MELRMDIQAGASAAEASHRRACECLARNEIDLAERLSHEALRSLPPHAGAHGVLGSISLARGDPRSALRYLEATSALGGASAATCANMALAQRALGQLSEALASLDAAISLAPAFVGALLARGVILRSRAD
jgi:tetratricopeptide (TPR) repeat protein